ncbi:circularly permuted type 2 ATP-grasp protein [Solirubrobacter taibaiensis]|nr:circularly permuted type 2 ATP-grasp protein [Solirubrobacter taibaiensis]
MTTPAGYDELHDASGALRPIYAALSQAQHGALAAPLAERPLGDDTRVAPIPLVLDDGEYRAVIEAGIRQRACALQALFADIVGGGRGVLGGGVLDEILASEGTSATRLRQLWQGRERDAVCFVYGPDLLREPSGRWVVIEDNVGCVGGCADASLVHDAYCDAVGLPRSPRQDLAVAVCRWLERLDVRPADAVAVVSDCGRDPRFGEDARRAAILAELGLQLETHPSPMAVVNVGAHARMTCERLADWVEQRVPMLNAPGTGVLGNKALLPSVNQLIRHYCGEEPLLRSPETHVVRTDTPVDGCVVKGAAGCGGGLPRTDELRVAQRSVEPSCMRDATVELRPFAYVLGYGDVVVAEHPVAKYATGTSHHISNGAAYAAVIRR